MALGDASILNQLHSFHYTVLGLQFIKTMLKFRILQDLSHKCDQEIYGILSFFSREELYQIQNGTWKQKQTITKTKTKKDAIIQLYETSLLYIDFSTLNALEVGSFVRRT